MLQHAGADEHQRNVCHEGCSRVHEHAYKDRYHGEGDDIDMQQTVADQQRGQQGKEDDERVDHGQRAGALKVPIAEYRQEKREGNNQHADVDNLSQERHAELLLVLLPALALLEERQ